MQYWSMVLQMKIHKGLNLVLLLFLGFISSDFRVLAQAAPPAAAAKHMLWKVTGQGCTVYLAGSVHFLKGSHYPLAPVIENAFTNSQSIAFETDMKEMEAPATQFLLLEKGTYQNGDTIEKHLSPKTYGLLKQKFEEEMGTADLMTGFRPWFAAFTLVAVELQKMGFDASQGMDQYFHKKAQERQMTETGLEPLAVQIAMIADLGAKNEEEFVLQTISEMNDFKKEFDQIISAWQTGNTAALEKQLLASFKGYPDIEKKLLTDRNQSWISKIETMLKNPEKKNAMVVVGAAHLVGKNGVPQLLQQKGYKVEQQ
ncbi:MAG: GumN family protein [Verrucomicrobiales bacterium]|nr:GumN family protein [Verrucomicrobiales bacterium]